MKRQRIEYKNRKIERGEEKHNDAEITGMVYEIQKEREESVWQNGGPYIDQNSYIVWEMD